MKLSFTAISAYCLIAAIAVKLPMSATAELIKMCLYYKEAGSARTDPILSQDCVSDHVHTFYGPQLFHPSTTNADLRNSDEKYSTSVYKENKSLYWHPTIYKVGKDIATNQPTYEKATIAFAGPYYRWDKDAPAPAVEAFPPGFQMIAGMNPLTPGLNLFQECLCPKPCTRSDGLCDSPPNSFFPSTACGEMGISMNFPTCWDDSKGIGDTGDHMSHMAYTVDGTVEGACPEGYNRRLPQIQLFVRIWDYEGGHYTFSDNTLNGDEEVFHADFMNGWEEGALENIVNNCEAVPNDSGDPFNPPCTCDQFLTKKDTMLRFDQELGRNDAEAAIVCPVDVKKHIVDEEIDFVVGGLPRGSCSAPVIEGVAPPYVDECGLVFTPNFFNEENCDANGNGNGEEDDSPDSSGEGEESNTSQDETNSEEEDSPDSSGEGGESNTSQDEINSNEGGGEGSQDASQDEENEEEGSSNENSEDNLNEGEESEDEIDNSDEEENGQSDENENPSDISQEDDEDDEEGDSQEEPSSDSSQEEGNEGDENEDPTGDDDDECKDDETFGWGKKNRGCAWVASRPQKAITRFCRRNMIKKACPITCGTNCLPCRDDPSFLFRGKENRNCKWVRRTVRRRPEICNQFSNGTKVRDACKRACGSC